MKNKREKMNSSMNINEKRNKTLLIVGIVLITIIVVLGIVFSILYFATDVLKSDKQLFMEYLSSAVDEKEGIAEGNLSKYFEKKETTPYTNEGSYSSNINIPNTDTEKVSNFNITFNGSTDKTNSKESQEISLNYSDEVNLPVKYKRVGNTAGIQTDCISNNYISVELDKLNQILGENSGNTFGSNIIIDITEKVEDIGFNPNFTISKEERKHIEDTYIKIIDEQLSKEKFSKIDGNGYKVILSSEDYKNILTKILQTLKTDNMMLSKINSIFKKDDTSKDLITSDNIDKMIEEISEQESQNTFEFIIYKKEKEINQIIMKVNGEESSLELKIDKQNANGDIKYRISVSMNNTDIQNMSFYIDIGYTGLSDMQNVSENYEIGIDTTQEEETMNYTLNFNNNISFADSIEVEDFAEGQVTLLTNYDSNNISKFLTLVTERLTMVNEQLMQKAGIPEDQNPIMYSTPLSILSLGIMTYNQSNSITSDQPADEISDSNSSLTSPDTKSDSEVEIEEVEE